MTIGTTASPKMGIGKTINKIPISIIYMGEPGRGKTHKCLTSHPNLDEVFFIDTTSDGEEYKSILKAFKYDKEKASKHYFNADDIDGIGKKVDSLGSDIKVVIVDSASDLQDMCIEKYVGIRKKHPKPFQFNIVRGYWIAIHSKIISKGYNLIYTTKVKDEYVALKEEKGSSSFADSAPTGKRIPAYFKGLEWKCDFIFEIVFSISEGRKFILRKSRLLDMAEFRDREFESDDITVEKLYDFAGIPKEFRCL